MSINLLFQKNNSCFVKNKQVEGLNILKNIWVKYPNNPSLFDKINKIIKIMKSIGVYIIYLIAVKPHGTFLLAKLLEIWAMIQQKKIILVNGKS